MPSASVKVEKINLAEAADPIKQFNLILEKKVRNLEKRKLKLDNYKNDVKNGKELNDDQKCAVSKYDQVVELLSYSKELNKAVNSITLESLRAQKKLAKKEQIERQQYEIQRLQEALYYKHILSCLESEDVRNDFLNEENGACKLSCEDLLHLDQLSKLIDPNLPNDRADIESCFHVLAENLIFLVEGKNKEIAGATYKELKSLLLNIKASGYFSKSSDSNDEASSDEAPELEEQQEKQSDHEEDLQNCVEENFVPEEEEEPEVHPEPVNEEQEVEVPLEEEEEEEPLQEVVPTPYMASPSNALQDVLASQGSFNFLQESQIELDRQIFPTPHMDPAVVAVHQLPPGTISYTMAPFATSQAPKDTTLKMMNDINHVPTTMAGQPIPIMTSALPQAMPQVLASVPHNGSPEFDPSHPIPTQTFTNQSFTVMQNMIIPSTYVPVTMPLPPAHMAQIAVMPPVSSPQNGIPMHVAVTNISIPEDLTSPMPIESVDNELQEEVEILTVNGNEAALAENEMNQNGASGDKDIDGSTNQNYRGYRGRGRGRGQMNGYYRGRGYNSRGSFPNHNYYQGNYRRGGPRGGGRNNNSSSRGGRGTNYQRVQPHQQHPSQNQ